MDCKITSTKRPRRGAFTLVELLIATGTGAVLLAALAILVFHTARSLAAISNYVDLDQKSRQALDRMVLEIRQADSLTSYSTNALQFAYNGGTLTYTYNSSAKTLTRTYGTRTDTLLKECDTLAFSIYQRNPVGGSYDVYPTASIATAKLVQMTWTCSRKILGQSVNTESVQSAKIVMRKQ